MSTMKKASTLSSVRFSINGREFYAEGDPVEVSKKFTEFMAGVLSPLHDAISWREILGIRAKRPMLRQVESRFKILAQKHHSDKGGDRRKFEAIVRARDAAKLELSR